jgi:uncharacterized membrane protein YphA (DoxX/SURF4 family)
VRKHKVYFLVSLLAAAAVGLSAFQPWWNGALPAQTDFLQLFQTAPLPPVNWTALSIAAVILASAILLLVGGLFAFKFATLLGWLVGAVATGLWFWADKISPLNFQSFGAGVWLMASGLILALLLLIFKKKRRKEK